MKFYPLDFTQEFLILVAVSFLLFWMEQTYPGLVSSVVLAFIFTSMLSMRRVMFGVKDERRRK